MGAKHPHLCLPVHFAVCDVVEKLLQELEQKVPDLSKRRKKKMRQYVYRRMRASIPRALIEAENVTELDEPQLSIIRSLVYSIFVRGIRRWWNMKPCNRNAAEFASTMSLNKDSQLQSSRRDNQTDGESDSGALWMRQGRRVNKLNDAQRVRLSLCAVSSHASADQIEKLCSCSICLEAFEENDQIVTLPCFHVYHRACVQRWLSSSDGCAVCRLVPTKLLQNTLELLRHTDTRNSPM
ncbi:E3 ubiquitin-protein ligase rnf181 [Clonorchis sinensis]|uniref:E3 ubiquitin-protein ligase rnf181 n=1 Tax=Clonorchis sinensis TaxID=79923 RepID=A0A8T1MWP1_CLOSI|nr:E3 ubiquitin-protein ligase rnf181 [Clonorchis sinensis]